MCEHGLILELSVLITNALMLKASLLRCIFGNWQALSGPMSQILDRLRMFGEFEVCFPLLLFLFLRRSKFYSNLIGVTVERYSQELHQYSFILKGITFPNIITKFAVRLKIKPNSCKAVFLFKIYSFEGETHVPCSSA